MTDWLLQEVVYYKRKLYCCLIDIPLLLNLEASAYRLAMTGHGTLIIVLVHLPTKKRLLRNNIETLLALGNAVILFGDLNTKNTNWHCNNTPQLISQLTSITDQRSRNIKRRVYNNDIDTAIEALTKYVRTMVKPCQRKVPANSEYWGLPTDVCDLIRAKNEPCAARVHTLHPSISLERDPFQRRPA
ncbi:hypothetical protein EVAR_47007_1 [Eumeta japonica]|uniref:RNA-directed DNA polymerase from mobile element jockey n=1 Tax=Eumeta variegata TaxID=151549 RepID=A0A4C1XF61_EUMVA|nr:hypothetical protein EVAR_47007_1 [Eumeta japonica]